MNKKEELERLGKLIKRMRTEKGFTQESLAYRVGKDHPSINRIEKGKSNPTYFYLLEICEGLDISLVELLDQDL